MRQARRFEEAVQAEPGIVARVDSHASDSEDGREGIRNRRAAPGGLPRVWVPGDRKKPWVLLPRSARTAAG